LFDVIIGLNDPPVEWRRWDREAVRMGTRGMWKDRVLWENRRREEREEREAHREKKV
jgi:hypothetical protein